MAVDEAKQSNKPSPKRPTPKKITIPPSSNAKAKAQKDGFTAEVFLSELKADETPTTRSEITVTDANGEKHGHPVNCLFCGFEIL